MMVLYLIIGFISLVSLWAFNITDIVDKLSFHPYSVFNKKEYYRFISSALVHGSITHLFINMFVLWSFGRVAMIYMQIYFREFNTGTLFVLFFVIGTIVSSLASFFKNKTNYYYSAIGASGAVSAVLFFTIFFAPYKLLYFFGILPIPGIVFGILYLYYSWKMAKKNVDNIGHDAHFWGAVFGIVFPLLIKPQLISVFITQLLHF